MSGNFPLAIHCVAWYNNNVADMAELADALVLGASGQPSGFKSRCPHHEKRLIWMHHQPSAKGYVHSLLRVFVIANAMISMVAAACFFAFWEAT